jgi:hypothetical protein
LSDLNEVPIRIGHIAPQFSGNTLRYSDYLPTLPDARPRKEMVEEQSFISGLTGYLSGLYADRIERSAKGEQCAIKLLFQL